MSEILDLKNYIMAMSSKLNQIVDMARNSFPVNDKTNEILNLMHKIALTNENKNKDIFDCMLPDLIKRISIVKDKHAGKALGLCEHVDFIIDKGRNKKKVHMFIRENGVDFHIPGKKTLFIEL